MTTGTEPVAETKLIREARAVAGVGRNISYPSRAAAQRIRDLVTRLADEIERLRGLHVLPPSTPPDRETAA